MPSRLGRLACLATLAFAVNATTARASDSDTAPDLLQFPALVLERLRAVSPQLLDWYQSTPAVERVAWGGLAACALLAGLTLLERLIRTRRRATIPRNYAERFHERLLSGRLDWHQAVDHCEMLSSPVTRIALCALRRAGRPGPEIERGMVMALDTESASLRRYIATLRRVACLAPLIGLLGTLGTIRHGLESLPPNASWNPIVAHALSLLIASVALAIVALVSYDGLSARVDGQIADLRRLGTELVDHLAAAPKPAASRPPVHPAHPGPAPHPGHTAGTRPPREV